LRYEFSEKGFFEALEKKLHRHLVSAVFLVGAEAASSGGGHMSTFFPDRGSAHQNKNGFRPPLRSAQVHPERRNTSLSFRALSWPADRRQLFSPMRVSRWRQLGATPRAFRP